MTANLSLPSGRHIYLIGSMGVGKSHLGRALATASDRPFLDSDEEIEKQAGMSINEIFQSEGETAFRELEKRALAKIAARDEASIVATGGGVVLSAENRECMRDSGVVIHLRVAPETLWRRVQNDSRRPLLQGENPRQKLEQIAQARQPLYRQSADAEIDADADAEAVMDAIAEAARSGARR